MLNRADVAVGGWLLPCRRSFGYCEYKITSAFAAWGMHKKPITRGRCETRNRSRGGFAFVTAARNRRPQPVRNRHKFLLKALIY
jgi:hypothetical protein